MKERKVRAVILFFVLLALISGAFYWGASLFRDNLSGFDGYQDIAYLFNIDAWDSLFIGCSISLLIVLLVYGVFKPLIVLFVYLSVQILCSIPLTVIYKLIGDGMEYESLSFTLLVSSVVTVAVLYFAHYAKVGKREFGAMRDIYVWICILALLFGMFASDLITECLYLENNLQQEFLDMSGTVVGALTIGVVGPIAEEFIFRSAILGSMLRRGMPPWIAIVVSAMIFGLVHGNPQQIPFAFFVGLLFAFVYYRTGSVVPCMICHIINNSTAVILMNTGSVDDNDAWHTLLGGNTGFNLSLICSLIVCICLLWVAHKRLKDVRWN